MTACKNVGRTLTMDLDEERVGALAEKIFDAVGERLRAPPAGRVAIYETLNALAVVAASVTCGCGADGPKMTAWFVNLLVQARVEMATIGDES